MSKKLGVLLLVLGVLVSGFMIFIGKPFGLLGVIVDKVVMVEEEKAEEEETVRLPSMGEAQFLMEDEGRSCHYEGNCTQCHPSGRIGEWCSVPLKDIESVACGDDQWEDPSAEFTGTDMVKEQRSLAPVLIVAIFFILFGMGVQKFTFTWSGEVKPEPQPTGAVMVDGTVIQAVKTWMAGLVAAIKAANQ